MTANKILPAHVVRGHAHLTINQHRIVLATGCFDILHLGHVLMLEQVRKRYPTLMLWIGINSDAAVGALKGPGRPVHDYRSRATVMAALECVNKVFEIDDIRVAAALRMVRPQVWVKGGDYTLETLDQTEVAAANEVQADILIIPTIGNYSTTSILGKL